MIWRVFFQWRRAIVCRRSGRCWRGRRGLCGHGWRTLRRGRNIWGWRGSRPFAPFTRFAAFQDDAAVFGHARPAGLDAILLQQFRNHRIRSLLVTQFRDGIMDWFQAVEWDTARIGPELLNCLVQRFKIGCWLWCGWYAHNLWMSWLKADDENPASRS